MPDRAELIRRSTLKARKSWEDYLKLQMRQIHLLFVRLYDEMAREAARHEKEGKIPPYRQQQLDDAAKVEAARLRNALAGSLKRGISRSVDYGFQAAILSLDAASAAEKIAYKIQIGTSFIGKAGDVVRWDAAKETFLQSAWHRANKQAVDAVLAWRPGGMVFSDRVWEVGWQTQKQLLAAVQRAVAEGRSAATLSRDIRHLLALPDTFRGEVLWDYQPGPGIYRSAYKNAMRLARTELNRAFTEATIRYAQSKDWIDGYIWWIGNVDACEICRPHNGQFFAKGEEPFIPVHPHCFCRLDLHIEGDVKPQVTAAA